MNARQTRIGQIVVLLLFVTGLDIELFLQANADIQIPQQSDWTEQGIIAVPGDWDSRLLGGFSPCAMIKLNDKYFVYYVGASGGRSDDNGPAFRALGVLASSDGITFTKHAQNPVITHWEPLGHQNAQEAGVWSCGATLDKDGNVLLYAGVMTAIGSSDVNDDGKLYVSTDGFEFELITTVLDHADSALWGAGDEIDPLGVVQNPSDGTWHMYYSPASHGWHLGHQSGARFDDFDSSSSGPVIQSGADVVGGADPILTEGSNVVLFIDRATNGWSDWFTEVRTVSLDAPQSISAPIETYDFPQTMGTAVYLDRDIGKWFMVYNRGDEQYTNNPGDGTTLALRTAPLVFDGDPRPNPPVVRE